MYQFPVKGLEKIRRTRKKVKNILGEFGLEECQNLSQELQEYYPGDGVFDSTDWSNLSDGFEGPWTKKWKYRSRGLCCSLCGFSTRFWNSFKNHIHRYHDEEERLCKLTSCVSCPFTAQPKLVAKHLKLFHLANSAADSSVPVLPARALNGSVFQCRKCHIQDTLLYTLKKHVLLYHYTTTLNKFAGQRSERELQILGDRTKKFYCKKCNLSAESSEHLLYHLLTSEKHKELDKHIQTQIFEKESRKYPVLAPKSSSTSGVLMLNDQANATAADVIDVDSDGPVPDPGPSQVLLPTQASALVQLASAEAKGLLQPGAPLVFPSAPISKPVVPPVSSEFPAPVSVGISGYSQLQKVPHQILLPPGVRLNVPAVRPPAQGLVVNPRLPMSQPSPTPQSVIVNPRYPVSQPSAGGAVLTSQSLLSHLVPTGNKVDGLPTYTLTPLQVLSVQGNNSQPATTLPSSQTNPRVQSKPAIKPTKKWVTCPICNELFPSDIYDSHPQVHKDANTPKIGLAARAPFLRKMPDKTVQCMTCKILISENGVFEHLLHGISCLFCPGVFFSIKLLVEHIEQQHSASRKTTCDFMRREYRLYTDDSGNLLFPYFDIRTTAPKLIMGDKELNLALVTNSRDLIFVKMLPNNPQALGKTPGPCKIPVPPSTSTQCPFCSDKLANKECYQTHLKEKHFIVPTLHAILKTPSYRCFYCGGVYTGKTTMKAIFVHLAKCRSAPQTFKDADKMLSGLAVTPRANRAHVSYPDQPRQIAVPTPTAIQASVPSAQPLETDAEIQSKMRLEIAFKEAIEANRREREERLARKRRLEKERYASPTPSPEFFIDPSVVLALDPAGMESRPLEERREFVNRYFNTNPYPLKKEVLTLSGRLQMNKTEVACQISSKRTRCMKNIQRSRAVVLLGFNMAEVGKLKHDLVIPEIEPEKVVIIVESGKDVPQE